MLLQTQADQRGRKLPGYDALWSAARCLRHLCEQPASRVPHSKRSVTWDLHRQRSSSSGTWPGRLPRTVHTSNACSSCVPVSKDFSIYCIKTIVMFLLSTMPVSQWHRRNFVLQVVDILEQLCLSLQAKQLGDFIVGNQWLLQEIGLPPRCTNSWSTQPLP